MEEVAAMLKEDFPYNEDETERKEWEVSEIDNIDPLKIVDYTNEDSEVFYLESEVFENLLGYTSEEILERTEEFYGVKFSEIEVDSYEYGNGWALFYVEE